jgi:RNA recognition motif-containing protein
LFTGGVKPARANGKQAHPPAYPRYEGASTPPPARKRDNVEVSSPKLYVGNLSFDATESDLFELFKGVGAVRNAEIVTHRHNEKSKGFGFVTMASVEEAKRAVTELHDKAFLGRKLVVSGAKSTEREPDYRG